MSDFNLGLLPSPAQETSGADTSNVTLQMLVAELKVLTEQMDMKSQRLGGLDATLQTVATEL